MAIEKIKLRNVADLSIEKVHCYRYFDEGNHRCEKPQGYNRPKGPKKLIQYIFITAALVARVV